MTFDGINGNCSLRFDDWNKKDALCTTGNNYHCLRNDLGTYGEICAPSTWIQPNLCPVYNTKVQQIDERLCKYEYGKCPLTAYLSDKVYQYSACFHDDNTATDSSTTLRSTTKAESGPGLPPWAVPILIVSLVLCIGILAPVTAFLVRRYRCRIKKRVNLDEEEPMLPDSEPEIQKHDEDNTFYDGIEAVAAGWKKLTQYGVVILVGVTGAGKTKCGLELLSMVRMVKTVGRIYKCYILRNFDDFEKFASSEEHYCLFLDDCLDRWSYSGDGPSIENDIIRLENVFTNYIAGKSAQVVLTVNVHTWNRFAKFFKGRNFFRAEHIIHFGTLSYKTKMEVLKKHLSLIGEDALAERQSHTIDNEHGQGSSTIDTKGQLLSEPVNNYLSTVTDVDKKHRTEGQNDKQEKENYEKQDKKNRGDEQDKKQSGYEQDKNNSGDEQDKQNSEDGQGKKNSEDGQGKKNSEDGQGKKNSKDGQNKKNSRSKQDKKKSGGCQDKKKSGGGPDTVDSWSGQDKENSGDEQGNKNKTRETSDSAMGRSPVNDENREIQGGDTKHAGNDNGGGKDCTDVDSYPQKLKVNTSEKCQGDTPTSKPSTRTVARNTQQSNRQSPHDLKGDTDACSSGKIKKSTSSDIKAGEDTQEKNINEEAKEDGVHSIEYNRKLVKQSGKGGPTQVPTEENKRERYRVDEKMMERIAKEPWKENPKKGSQPKKPFYLGFPEACVLYSRDDKILEKGEEFFKDPINCLSKIFSEWRNSKEIKEREKYVALVYMLMNGGYMDIRSIKGELLNIAKSFCEDGDEINEHGVKDGVEVLARSYCVEKSPGCFEFQHEVIEFTLMYVAVSKHPKKTFENCDLNVLKRYMITKKNVKPEGELKVSVEEEYFGLLINRFVKSGVNLLNHRCMEDEEFKENSKKYPELKSINTNE